ncbi:MAG: hypothetical protein IH613_15470 [Desulfuromonadales bacterium]|nr:hypothetical protein [Desulfuromonadales bacterium]
MNRKRVILAALLGVLALCVLYAYFATPRLEKVPPKVTSPRPRPAAKATVDMKSAEVQKRINFDFLAYEPQEFPGAKRDIFRFVQQRPVRIKPPAPVVKIPVVETVEPKDVAEPFKAVIEPISNFTFLGFLEKAGEKIVFLSSGGNLFLVKRGESFGINQEFVVDDIFDNTLKVRHTDQDRLITIPLIEQQKLRAAVSAPAHREPRPEVSIPQPRARVPRSRSMTTQEGEATLPVMTDENTPEEMQQFESPAEGDVLEGEANGTNQ